MIDKFLIDSCKSINTILKFDTIKGNRSTLNIGDNNPKSIQYCAKKHEWLRVKLIQFNLSWNLQYKTSYSDVLDKSFGTLFRYLNLIPFIGFSFN